MRLEQRQVAKVGIKGQLAFTLAGLGDITAIHQHQRVGRTGPHAGRALVIEVAEVAFFEILPASDGSAYKEYVLTEKGRSVFPIVVALRQWGERYMFEQGETYSVLLDNAHGQPLQYLDVRSAQGDKLQPGDCHRRRIVSDTRAE